MFKVLKRIKKDNVRGYKIGYIFGQAKRRAVKKQEWYEKETRSKNIQDVIGYIQEEADRHPGYEWRFADEESLNIRGKEIFEEWAVSSFWYKLALKFMSKQLAAEVQQETAQKVINNWKSEIFGEAQFKEKNGRDLVELNLNVFILKWHTYDFKATFDMKETIQSIVRHEFRHAEQIKSLREAGGSELVWKAYNLKKKYNYGSDPMEWDAFQVQFGNERPIEEFVKEVIEE